MKFKNSLKVFIIGGGHQYVFMFLTLGITVVSDLKDADLVCFTGGADVSPGYYGDHRHHTTFSDISRDKQEEKLFEQARDSGLPMVGICRGGQFLNVMNGGRMYQDVSRHGASHYITDLETGETVYVSSTHHQMMMPGRDAILIASSHLGGYREWFDGPVIKRDQSQEDIEVLFYPQNKCLCFQPHPEFTGAIYEPMLAYFASCLRRFLIKEKEDDSHSSSTQHVESTGSGG